MARFDLTRHHGKHLVLLHHPAPRLHQIRQPLLELTRLDRPANNRKRAFVVIYIDRYETPLRKIIRSVRTTMIKGQRKAEIGVAEFLAPVIETHVIFDNDVVFERIQCFGALPAGGGGRDGDFGGRAGIPSGTGPQASARPLEG